MVILVADHGTIIPFNTPNHAAEKFQIPMIWLGGALAMCVITRNALWVMAYIPSLLLVSWLAEPIAKYLGWENEKR